MPSKDPLLIFKAKISSALLNYNTLLIRNLLKIITKKEIFTLLVQQSAQEYNWISLLKLSQELIKDGKLDNFTVLLHS